MLMRTRFLTACVLLGACAQRLSLPKDASWNAKSATFAWWGGEVALPVGFIYRVDQGTDSFEGHFTSPDGKVVVRHDIGGYAGAWAARGKALVFAETVVEDTRVWTAKRDWPDGKGGHTTLIAVTFPDSGCANFFLESSKPEDAAVINFVARSFRPKGPTRRGEACR
jgi:hypothetical protein